jgi:membrane-bound metal-dependent hydrolase YbcI (DUF457 family)
MTTYEHVMLGVNEAMAVGLHRRCGWKIVAMAGVVAITPDWDGLTFLGGMDLFDRGHRAWGHNLLIASLLGCLCGLADYRFDLVGRARQLGKRFFPQGQSPADLRTRDQRTLPEYGIWAVVSLVVALSHLPADMVVSGAAGLSDWHLQLLWPFANRGFVHPLVPWGDPGVTLVFVGGMFAMLRWPKRLQMVAIATLLLAGAYLVVRGNL